MKRWLWLILALILVGGLVFLVMNREPQDTEKPVKNVVLLNPSGPLVVPIAPLAGGKISGNLDIEVKFWKTNDEAIAALASNQADFAVLPVTTAANIDASDIPVTMLGIHEWKIFYMVAAADRSFDDFASLAGQEVYVAVGRGTTIDVLLRSALSASGLNPDRDVKLLYAPPQEIVALFKSGKAVYAALPEPFVTLTVSGGNGRIVADFQEYYGNLVQGEPRIPVAGLFVQTAFAAEHPEQTAEVVHQCRESIQWYLENTDQALELSKTELPIPAPVMKKSLERTDFYWVPAQECSDEVEVFLTQMKELYPEGIKRLPGKGFYAE